MASLGTFGIPEGADLDTSKSVKQSTNAVELTDKDGNILEFTTKGGSVEKTQESYLGPSVPADSALTATDGQNGTTVTTSDGYDLKAGEYGSHSTTKKMANGAIVAA